MRVEYVKKQGRKVLEYGLSNGSKCSKEELIKLIEASEIENAKIQEYKENKIVRLKDGVKEVAVSKPKTVDKITEISVGRVLTQVVDEMGISYNGFTAMSSRVKGKNYLKNTTKSIKRTQKTESGARNVSVVLFGRNVLLANNMPEELSNEQMVDIKRRLAIELSKELREMFAEYSKYVIRNIENGAVENL